MRWIVFFLATILGACGFAPLYGDGGGRIAAELGSIEIQSVTGAENINFELQKELERFFPQTADTAYKMNIALQGRHRSTAVTSLANTIRFNYELNVVYTLEDLATGQSYRDSKFIVTSYGIVVSEYSSRVGREVAEQKAAQEAAERIKFELIIFLRNKDGGSLTEVNEADQDGEITDDSAGIAPQSSLSTSPDAPLPINPPLDSPLSDSAKSDDPVSGNHRLGNPQTDGVERIGTSHTGNK